MCKKFIYLVCFVLVLGLVLTSRANAADPNLVGWWKLNDGSGDTAMDSSGNGNNGTLNGGPKWVAGMIRGALELDGVDDFVEVPHADILTVDNEVTVMAWIHTSRHGGPGTESYQGIVAKSNSTRSYSLYTQSAGTLHFSTAGVGSSSSAQVPLNEWVHVCAMVVGGQHVYYINGEPAGTGGSGINLPGAIDTDNVVIGRTQEGATRSFLGMIDDVRIYNHALTQEEIQEAMIGIPPGVAEEPSPDDEATDVPRDVTLSWTPGEFAAPTNGHKVYFGESFDDVNDATGGVAQSASSYAPPQRLDFSKTYYWRVDEVNAPPTSHIEFKGKVWQFTTEPIAYAIENITATASSVHQADTGPENTINGSGLDVNDLHSTESTDMWLSNDEPNGAWIEYELDKVYKLHEMRVWNSNQMVEPMIGFGLKDVTIEYSTNGTDYTTLGTTHEFVRAPGADGYEHNTTVDFGGATAKYVRLTANSNWGGFMSQYGLSEVRFFSIPVYAREASPDSDTTDVAVDVTLGFRAGREADTHDVYLSTDEQAVIDGNTPVTTVTENSFGPLSLELGTTYYWKINEANDAETPTTWQGDIWNFTTQEYLVVDDFEDYNDYPPNEIWSTWIDGYGVLTNGATVGYPNPDWNQDEHYVETANVHGGEQAMPFFYDNTGGATYSEGTANVADLQVGQDWTKGAPETLVLWIRGDLSNAAANQLYVKINDTKVMYDGDLSIPIWKQWNVDLASLGINLSNITTLIIGVDGGGSGMLYVDDIALYRIAPPVVEPPPGSDMSLVGHWKLDETSGLTAADSSGYGNDGTLIGMTGTEWTAGIKDGALEFAGGNANNPKYVDFGSDESLWLTGEATISAWVKMNAGNDGVYMGIGGKLISGYYQGFALVRHSSNVFRLWCDDGAGVLAGHEASSDVTYTDTEWHHVAGVIDDGTSSLYVDGVKQVQEGDVDLTDSGGIAYIGKQYGDNSSHRYWNGLIDDVRIYYRALSAAEIAGL